MTSSDTTTDHPIVLSATIDAATVESTRWMITELRRDGFSVETVAETAATHLADTVARYRPHAAPVVPEDYDPTDAELERSWNAPDAPEAHRVAWVIHQELRS